MKVARFFVILAVATGLLSVMTLNTAAWTFLMGAGVASLVAAVIAYVAALKKP